ncbi:hypothetical protein ABKN59_011284 [Abortiporus biennis]
MCEVIELYHITCKIIPIFGSWPTTGCVIFVFATSAPSTHCGGQLSMLLDVAQFIAVTYRNVILLLFSLSLHLSLLHPRNSNNSVMDPIAATLLCSGHTQ